MDTFSREALAIEVGKLLRAEDVSGRLLDMRDQHYREPIDFSQPGEPTENRFIETFNGSLRDECLNLHWSESSAEATRKIEAWGRDNNEGRLHIALKELTSGEFSATNC